MKECVFGFYPPARDMYSKPGLSYDRELLYKHSSSTYAGAAGVPTPAPPSALQSARDRRAALRRSAGARSAPSGGAAAHLDVQVRGVAVQAPSALTVVSPATVTPGPGRTHRRTQAPSRGRLWAAAAAATPVSMATVTAHTDPQQPGYTTYTPAETAAARGHTAPVAWATDKATATACGARPAAQTTPSESGLPPRPPSKPRAQSARLRARVTSPGQRDAGAASSTAAPGSRGSGKRRPASAPIPRSSSSQRDVTPAAPPVAVKGTLCPSPHKIPTPFEADTESVVSELEADQRSVTSHDRPVTSHTEDLVRDAYDRELDRRGWRMEIPGDPLNLKRPFLSERRSYTVTCAVPEVQKPGPGYRSECFETFFYNTIPRRPAAFTVDKEWASEMIHAQRLSFQKRHGGGIKYKYKKFAFLY